MHLTILNNKELDAWMDERRVLDHDVYSIKGAAPEDATFEDGTLIVRLVNVAWQDIVTGEVFHINYKQ